MDQKANLHAVPNPENNPENNQTKELIKTVALTSAVSTLVGAFALAGGQALFRWVKGSVKNKNAGPNPQIADPFASWPGPRFNPAGPRPQQRTYRQGFFSMSGYPHDEDAEPNPEPEDPIPESLRMRPDLRDAGPKRRKVNPKNFASSDQFDELKMMFSEFANRQDHAIRNLERRIDEELYEDEDDD